MLDPGDLDARPGDHAATPAGAERDARAIETHATGVCHGKRHRPLGQRQAGGDRQRAGARHDDRGDGGRRPGPPGERAPRRLERGREPHFLAVLEALPDLGGQLGNHACERGAPQGRLGERAERNRDPDPVADEPEGASALRDRLDAIPGETTDLRARTHRRDLRVVQMVVPEALERRGQRTGQQPADGEKRDRGPRGAEHRHHVRRAEDRAAQPGEPPERHPRACARDGQPEGSFDVRAHPAPLPFHCCRRIGPDS